MNSLEKTLYTIVDENKTRITKSILNEIVGEIFDDMSNEILLALQEHYEEIDTVLYSIKRKMEAKIEEKYSGDK